MLLLSEDFGKHLMGVEDLLEKHGLLEADVVSYGMRVQQINQQATKFMDEKGPDGSGGYHIYMANCLCECVLRVRNESLQSFVCIRGGVVLERGRVPTKSYDNFRISY